MTNEAARGQNCGMTIEDGTYCQYCTDEDGNLQSFDEQLERMVQWMQRQEQAGSRRASEQNTLAYTAKMPAWRDHPKVLAAQD